MKTKLALTSLLILIFNNFALSNEINCKEIKKFSTKYFKCKGNLLKNKTIYAGQNIIQSTKDYQKKEWSDEKKKIDNMKKKVLD